MTKNKNIEITTPEHPATESLSSSDNPDATVDISNITNSAEDLSYKIKFKNLLELTRSICHELSQPVTILLGYSEMMLSNMETNDPLYNKLNEINKQADKTDEIIRRMHRNVKYISEDNTSDSVIIGKI